MNDDSEFDGLSGLGVAVIVIVLMLILGAQALVYEKPVEEKFKVTTKAGEVFAFDARHRCKQHYRKAATTIYGAQDKRLSDFEIKQLPTLVESLTYVYGGKVKESVRCDILQNKVKAVTRLPEPKKKK